jgi:hypothetical protein
LGGRRAQADHQPLELRVQHRLHLTTSSRSPAHRVLPVVCGHGAELCGSQLQHGLPV